MRYQKTQNISFCFLGFILLFFKAFVYQHEFDEMKYYFQAIEILIKLFVSPMSVQGRLTPAQFEKDDDANGHIDFITAAAVSCWITDHFDSKSLTKMTMIYKH